MGGGPHDKLLCILPIPEPKDILLVLREQFPDIEIAFHGVEFLVDRDTAPEVPKELFGDITILFTLFSLPKQLSDAPHLKWVHLLSAGSNHVQKHLIYTDSKISITTSSGVHGPQISEWTVMTHLIQTHHYPQFYEAQKAHKWAKPDISDQKSMSDKKDSSGMKMRDRVGLRLGVLGYGSIGRQTARVAKAMGMDIVAYTATPKDTAEKKRDGGYIVPGTGDAEGELPSEWYSGLEKKALHNFLKQNIDWLLIAVPLTDDTKGFLGKEEFDVLSQGGKRPAFVTNIARGAIVKQDELIDAVKDGRVSGAALDVTDPEPLPEDSELWDLKNVTITPHISGLTDSYAERSFGVLETNLKRWQKGDKLVNEVNRKRGY